MVSGARTHGAPRFAPAGVGAAKQPRGAGLPGGGLSLGDWTPDFCRGGSRCMAGDGRAGNDAPGAGPHPVSAAAAPQGAAAGSAAPGGLAAGEQLAGHGCGRHARVFAGHAAGAGQAGGRALHHGAGGRPDSGASCVCRGRGGCPALPGDCHGAGHHGHCAANAAQRGAGWRVAVPEKRAPGVGMAAGTRKGGALFGHRGSRVSPVSHRRAAPRHPPDAA